MNPVTTLDKKEAAPYLNNIKFSLQPVFWYGHPMGTDITHE